MGKRSKQKRELILNAAERVFSIKDYKSVSMQDIAAEAGISRSGVYVYFNNTRSILRQLQHPLLAALELFVKERSEWRGSKQFVEIRELFEEIIRYGIARDEFVDAGSRAVADMIYYVSQGFNHQ